MRKTRRTTTEPFTPQNMPTTSTPAIDLNNESDKRLNEKVSTEEAYNDTKLKEPTAKKKEPTLQKQVKQRKPGDDVDPDQSINNE